MSLLVLSWADLVLDSENPRLEDAGDTTRESINSLLDLEPIKMVNLARDISVTGMLSPFDLPGVIVEDGAHIVIEGNRRVAALKMLKSPELIDEARLRRRVEVIAAATGTGPDEVACSLFESRGDAERWIELRHNGENEGRGVSPWTPDMSNRFNPRPGSQIDLAMQLRDLMLAAYPSDTELSRQLNVIFRGGLNSFGERGRRRPTTFGRLIEPPNMQEAFGYKIGSGSIHIVGPESAVHNAFRQIILDVAEGMTAREINSKQQIADYITANAHLKVVQPTNPPPRPSAPSPGAPPAPSPGTSPAGSSGSPGSGGNAPAPPPTPTPTRRRMPPQEAKIFQGLRLTQFDLRTSRTLDQARTLHIDRTPAVCGVMLRVIVELCATEAIQALSLNANEGDKLHKKLRAVLLHLDPDIESARCDKTLEPAWINSQRGSGDGLGVVLMNAFVHSITQPAAPSEVRTLSGIYKPVLQRLNDLLP